MVDIFDEIQEDLRAERAGRLMRRYGWLLVVAAVLIVAGVVGWQQYQERLARADSAAALRYIAAINAIQAGPATSSHADQIPVLEQIAASAPEGYKTLALLRAAGLKAANGDLPGAEAMWNQVAGDGAADPLLRDFASLMAAQHGLDTGNPDQLQARLKALASPDNPWSALAREQLAMLDLRQGKIDEARATLKILTNDILAPNGVRSRAQALLLGLGQAGTT